MWVQFEEREKETPSKKCLKRSNLKLKKKDLVMRKKMIFELVKAIDLVAVILKTAGL